MAWSTSPFSEHNGARKRTYARKTAHKFATSVIASTIGARTVLAKLIVASILLPFCEHKGASKWTLRFMFLT